MSISEKHMKVLFSIKQSHIVTSIKEQNAHFFSSFFKFSSYVLLMIWFVLLLIYSVERWNILDVLARLPNTLPIDLCLSCVPTGDALLRPQSMARLQCWWLPRLRELASKPAVPLESYWCRCISPDSCLHYLNSGKVPLKKVMVIISLIQPNHMIQIPNLNSGREFLKNSCRVQKLPIESRFNDVLHWYEDLTNSGAPCSVQHLPSRISWWDRLRKFPRNLVRNGTRSRPQGLHYCTHYYTPW